MSFSNIRVQQYILFLGILLFVAKIIAWKLTNSVAVLTDALESTVNVITGFTGLLSLYISARPRDENHPYGHGKIELISASLEGGLIMLAGLMIVYECAMSLFDPPAVHRLDQGMMILGAAAAVNYLIGAWGIRTGQRNHSMALIASGKHLQSDTWTTVGIILGLLAVQLTGITRLDSLVALLFASYIIYEGGRILRQTIAGIMDEADTEVLKGLVLSLNQHRPHNWIDIHNVRIIKYGSILHLDGHLTLPWYFNIREAQQEIQHLHDLVGQQFPQQLEMFVHSDACTPPVACSICLKKDCLVRQKDFQHPVTWTLENITRDEVHVATP